MFKKSHIQTIRRLFRDSKIEATSVTGSAAALALGVTSTAIALKNGDTNLAALSGYAVLMDTILLAGSVLAAKSALANPDRKKGSSLLSGAKRHLKAAPFGFAIASAMLCGGAVVSLTQKDLPSALTALSYAAFAANDLLLGAAWNRPDRQKQAAALPALSK
ncbi:MAG: hypothetical protein PHE27_07885 [Alphaproteobacteria bacterium]|nr:hypothetical protein [Alphaproteobacteria bacterium]